MQPRKVEHGLVGPTRYGEEENPTVVCTKTSSPLFARRVSNAKAHSIMKPLHAVVRPFLPISMDR